MTRNMVGRFGEWRAFARLYVSTYAGFAMLDYHSDTHKTRSFLASEDSLDGVRRFSTKSHTLCLGWHGFDGKLHMTGGYTP